MNKKIIGLTLLFLLTIGLTKNAVAQNATSFRINEVLMVNQNNVTDEYGQHPAWIELWNASFAHANLKGSFIEVTQNGRTTRYTVPRSDGSTLVPARQHALFWADGLPKRGTFHTNFMLDAKQDCKISLIDLDGNKVIDTVLIPANTIAAADQSYARDDDGSANWTIKGGNDVQHYVTPYGKNQTADLNTKADNFKTHDSIGLGMAITAMGVVFFGLIMLYFTFFVIGKIAASLSRRNAMKIKGITDVKDATEKQLGAESADVIVAISMALHEFQSNVHDEEDMQLTINQIKRMYSPWSSKIYMMRHLPERK
ncbi:MAG: OadG family transporter subunit [Bacteroidaceae bacterium]